MNPLYKQYNQMPGNMQGVMNRFKQFQQSFRGDPQQIVQQMLNSGKISQEQFNNAVKIANQMIGYFK